MSHPGFPCRLIAPGLVGARSVKWLSKIVVSENESDSWYHWNDNKVLASERRQHRRRDGRLVLASGYTLYELNINSVITTPKHNEYIRADDPLVSYTIRALFWGGGKSSHCCSLVCRRLCVHWRWSSHHSR